MFGTAKHSGPKETEVDLNRVVTPMLDMTFQILFFLIMNFRLPTPEGQVELKILDDIGPPSSPVSLIEDEKSDEYRLRLLIFRNADEQQGLIAGMSWRSKGDGLKAAGVPIPELDPASTTEGDKYFQGLSPKMYGLVDKLREIQPKDGGKQPSIVIECDSKLRYSELLKVMDVLRYMKFNNVGVVPIPKS